MELIISKFNFILSIDSIHWNMIHFVNRIIEFILEMIIEKWYSDVELWSVLLFTIISYHLIRIDSIEWIDEYNID